MDYDEQQQIAIQRCCDMSPTARVCAVTGAAGTGKTTIIREVHQRLSDAGYSVALCAPTGKAAKRIREATGIAAQTIHQLLAFGKPRMTDEGVMYEPGPSYGVPKRWKGETKETIHRLELDCIIADEYAMVPRWLHRNIIDSMAPGACIRMFGDANQLRPIDNQTKVGDDSAFERAIVKFDGVKLEHIYRQHEGSGIVAAGAQIIRGRMPLRADDFMMKISNTVVPILHKLVTDGLNDGVSYASVTNQIITPSKTSLVGAYKINNSLRQILNPRGRRVPLPRHDHEKEMPLSVAVGDKVICNENYYSMDGSYIMNGETGVVTDIDDTGVIHIDVGDRVVIMPPSLAVPNPRRRGTMIDIDPRKSLSLAYAVTTHKAQGSEFDNVIYLMHRVAPYNHCRSNLYTGVTRAKRRATIVSDQQSLWNSLQRITSLVEDRGRVANA